MPPDASTIGDWVTFGVSQTSRLEIANGRKSDVLFIIDECEALRKAAVEKSKPWYEKLFK
jgi:hypothetical protein